MQFCEFAFGLPQDSLLLLHNGAVLEVGMLDNMDDCNEADDNSMEISQQHSLCREDRSRSRDFAWKRLPPLEPCRPQQQQNHLSHKRHCQISPGLSAGEGNEASPLSQASLSNPSTGLSAGEALPLSRAALANPSTGLSAGEANEAAIQKASTASTRGEISTPTETAKTSNFKERKNPITNLQPEFLSAILDSDDQLEYHTDALLGYYDADSDKRLMMVDLKDFLPTFYGQLGCGQPKPKELLELFVSSDLDRDGSLDRNEFKGFLQALLKQGQEACALSQL